MIKSVQDAAYLRLVEAIYRRAKLDYYEALILQDYGKRKEVERFFLNDPYIYLSEQGKDIIETCKNKVNSAINFVEDFIETNQRKLDIPANIDTDAVIILCRKIFKNCYYSIDKNRVRFKKYMPMIVRRKKK